MKNKILPPQEYLKARLRYERSTGKLYWKRRPRAWFSAERGWRRWNTRYAGKEAFIYVGDDGHRIGAVDHCPYFAHRIIWKIVTGGEPPFMLDHRDRDPANNRWKNLRAAGYSENSINRTRSWGQHPNIGVRPKKSGSWEARIHKDKKYFHLGTFASEQEAIAARKAKAIELYGAFAP